MNNDKNMLHFSDEMDMLEDLKKELLFHKITKAEKTGEQSAIIELDNGRRLDFHGNVGCGNCYNGWFFLEKFIDHIPDNAITNVTHQIEYTRDEEYGTQDVETFVVNIFFEEEKMNLVTYEGTDNGYYGTGFSICVSIID